MSTNASVVVKDGDGGECVSIYKHWDGYPSELGVKLAKFLDDMEVVNGIGVSTPEKTANGAGCLAAQLVKHFKEKAGDVYLQPYQPNEFNYVVTAEAGKAILIVVTDGDRHELFSGDAKALGDWAPTRG